MSDQEIKKVLWLKWTIVGVGVVIGGYMAFDGVWALTAGDYLVPRTGPHAGQLGPWSGMIERAGLEPRSAPVKSCFVVFGIAWLSLVAAYATGQVWGGWGLMILSVLSLWYLPFGTLLALVELGLLLMAHLRAP